MKNLFTFSVLCFAFILIALPARSHAYFTTAQSAVKLEDGKGILYSVTYDFGMKKNDLIMPIVPERKEASSTEQARTMTYAFVDKEGNESALGESTAVVVSNAEIRDGHYFIPRGEGKRMTLIALLSLPQTLVYEPYDLSLLVTNLPFTIVTDQAEYQNQLNPSELQYYRTPSITN